MIVNPTTTVYRKQVVEGFSIPAIIHNGSYFFVDIAVYADGRVDCWNFEDLEHFKKDVKRGWVEVAIPDNEAISIHGLGSWIITNGSWLFNRDSFIDYVLSLIKTLNPRMENIYQYREKMVGNVRIGDSANGSIYKEHKRSANDLFPDKIGGQGIHLFYKVADAYYLINVVVFSDLTIGLHRLENTVSLTLPEFEELIQKEIIIAEIPDQARVHIYGLGSFTILKRQYSNDIQEKLLEVKDMIREIKGEPSSIDVCRAAYQQYLDQPTQENKELLRTSYENVPDHQKMYVGDMDTKDVAVRMIIYGDQEIENWSHYRVAKARNEKLPTINVPKPTDESES
ncbi:DUF7638 domain-containing protein [Chitinophaga qingshengii]|uniref:Uncharacterized protein n=1 Tax=Chitinophaga qingshengii TaxID=1569794 RepID=A0ABR7TM72_9BACT|nr:hypothetical protein [Chitinophaga qingshengii]MBC9930159.1 hypothetical protein [Chitinophaga qingshengii]